MNQSGLLPRQSQLDADANIIVIECCQDCPNHQTHTHHDESKYAGIATRLAAAIQAENPGTLILYNQVPKAWFQQEIYCQLIPNDDEESDVYDMIPRLGAFEVSTVIPNEGSLTDILFFSKLLSSLWPHTRTVSTKLATYFDDMK